MIVLLPKKNDQRRLTNKRPIALLNVAYKIAAKAFQNCLSPILQRVILPQQFVFLPRRNIQHSLLLLGETLNQAACSGEEFVFLKLDVVKAFDRLDPFMPVGQSWNVGTSCYLLESRICHNLFLCNAQWQSHYPDCTQEIS